MKRKKNITLLFDLEEEHLGKDVFLVPFYLGKVLNATVNIAYSRTDTNKGILKQWRGIHLIPLGKKGRGPWHLFYLLRRAWRIDVLMLFHFSYTTLILGLVYKLLCPRGKLYIKGDGLAIVASDERLRESHSWKAKIVWHLFKLLFLKVDLVSIEGVLDFNRLCQSVFGVNIQRKLSLMPNGFDDEALQELNIHVRGLSQKENIFLTVGRLGAFLKNTEMLLGAVEQVNLKGWKVVLVGPIEQKESDFQAYIDAFFQRNPHLQESVIFTGAIYDKQELWEWHNRSKVFVFPSRFESFGIVLMDAFRFNDYILSTRVGFAEQAVGYGYGELMEQENVEGLSKRLQDIVDGTTCLLEQNLPDERIHEQFTWMHLVQENLKFD